MSQITVLSKDGVPMWSVNGRNFATKEEAEAYEQKILEYYETHRYTGD